MRRKLLVALLGVSACLAACATLAFNLLFPAAPDGSRESIVQKAEIGLPTLVAYGFSSLLLVPGLKLAARLKRNWPRSASRLGLVALLLAPGILADPGGLYLFVLPAWIPGLLYSFLAPALGLAIGLLPIALVWLGLLAAAIACKVMSPVRPARGPVTMEERP